METYDRRHTTEEPNSDDDDCDDDDNDEDMRVKMRCVVVQTLLHIFLNVSVISFL